MNIHTFEVDLDGRKLTIETGKIAKQASGSVVVRWGDSVVLVTACSAAHPKPNQSFFPLTCDYREYTYAAGKIPGGYIKREGRMSEKETLTSRMIDRPLRPLFPEGYLDRDADHCDGPLGGSGTRSRDSCHRGRWRGACYFRYSVPPPGERGARGPDRWQIHREPDVHRDSRVEAQHDCGGQRPGNCDGRSRRAAGYRSGSARRS